MFVGVFWPVTLFFFQAEDGIRDKLVTGVQTCALTISGHDHRRDELLSVALEPGAAKLDQCLLILIENQTVVRAVDTKLMELRAHLRGESKIGGEEIGRASCRERV